MKFILSLAPLLPFALAAEFYSEYTEFFPVNTQIVLCGHTYYEASVYSRVELPDYEQVNHFTISNTKSYYFYGKGSKWFYHSDGRISLISEPKRSCHIAKADELLFMRAKLLPNGQYRLTMADQEEPLAPSDLDNFIIRCKPDTTECIIQLEEVTVPYRNDHNDQRPLVLDMKDVTYGWLRLWPANNSVNQLFNIKIAHVDESV